MGRPLAVAAAAALLLLVVLLAAAPPPAAARSALYNTTGGPVDDGRINVHVISHTHNDPGWLSSYTQYHRAVVLDGHVTGGVEGILDTVVLELMDNPDRTFVYADLAFFVKWWQELHEDTRALVRHLVREGRFEFTNGGLVQHDEATSHYSSMVDQMALGMQFLRREFNVSPKIAWQLDGFGHSSTEPLLKAGMGGFEALFFGRSDQADLDARARRGDLDLVWRGSGAYGAESDLLVCQYPTGNYGPPDMGRFFFERRNDYGKELADRLLDDPETGGFNVGAAVDSFVDKAREWARAARGRDVVFLMGSDFTHSDARAWYSNVDKLIHYVNRDGRVNAFYSTPSRYVAAKRAAVDGGRDGEAIVAVFGDGGTAAADADADAADGRDGKKGKSGKSKKAKTKSKKSSNKPGAVAKVDDGRGWALKTDDFFPYSAPDDGRGFWTGYFTTRPTYKWQVRAAAALLQATRQVEALAGLAPRGRQQHLLATTRGDRVDSARERGSAVVELGRRLAPDADASVLEFAVAMALHHDAITGTQKFAVLQDYRAWLAAGVAKATPRFLQGLERLVFGNGGDSARGGDEEGGAAGTTAAAAAAAAALGPAGGSGRAAAAGGRRQLHEPQQQRHQHQQLEQQQQHQHQQQQQPRLEMCHLLNATVCAPSERFSAARESFLLVVYNPLAWAHEWGVRLPVADRASFVVTGPDGAAVPSQLLPLPDRVEEVWDDTTGEDEDTPARDDAQQLLALRVSAPPLGHAVYRVDVRAAPGAAAVARPAGGRSIKKGGGAGGVADIDADAIVAAAASAAAEMLTAGKEMTRERLQAAAAVFLKLAEQIENAGKDAAGAGRRRRQLVAAADDLMSAVSAAAAASDADASASSTSPAATAAPVPAATLPAGAAAASRVRLLGGNGGEQRLELSAGAALSAVADAAANGLSSVTVGGRTLPFSVEMLIYTDNGCNGENRLNDDYAVDEDEEEEQQQQEEQEQEQEEEAEGDGEGGGVDGEEEEAATAARRDKPESDVERLMPFLQPDKCRPGAYVFSAAAPPNVLKPLRVYAVEGPVVSELRVEYEYGAVAVRLWGDGSDGSSSGSSGRSSGSGAAPEAPPPAHLEVEWSAGPLPQGNNAEVFVRYNAGGLRSGGLFYTDANGREFQQRRRAYRPAFELPARRLARLPANIYPITTGAYLRDVGGGDVDAAAAPGDAAAAATAALKEGTIMAVAVDRAQGVVSPLDGVLDFNVHRISARDDGKGMNEPLYDPSAASGTHLVSFHLPPLPSDAAAAKQQQWSTPRHLQQALVDPPQLAFGKAPPPPTPGGALRPTSTGLADGAALPANAHLLTLRWHSCDQLLVRLSHMFQAGEPQAAAPGELATATAVVDLRRLLRLPVAGVREATLWGDRPLQAADNAPRAPFRYGQNLTRWDPPLAAAALGEPRPLSLVRNRAVEPLPAGSSVTLQPMQIRTFFVTVARPAGSGGGGGEEACSDPAADVGRPAPSATTRGWLEAEAAEAASSGSSGSSSSSGGGGSLAEAGAAEQAAAAATESVIVRRALTNGSRPGEQQPLTAAAVAAVPDDSVGAWRAPPSWSTAPPSWSTAAPSAAAALIRRVMGGGGGRLSLSPAMFLAALVVPMGVVLGIAGAVVLRSRRPKRASKSNQLQQ